MLWIAEEAALVGLIVLLFVFPILVNTILFNFVLLKNIHINIKRTGECKNLHSLHLLGIFEEKSDENQANLDPIDFRTSNLYKRVSQLY